MLSSDLRRTSLPRNLRVLNQRYPTKGIHHVVTMSIASVSNILLPAVIAATRWLCARAQHGVGIWVEFIIGGAVPLHVASD